MTGISVGDYRDPERRARARRADGRGRARARRRAGPALQRRGDPRQGLAARGARHRAEGLPAPARPDAVRRRRGARGDGPPLHRGRVPASRSRTRARGRAARQRHDRRDRRLPDRGRGRVRAHAGTPSTPPASPACTRSPIRRGPARSPPSSATASRRRRRSAARRCCAATPRSARATTGRPSSAARERVLVDKVADTQCSGYTADYTRCYLPAGAAARGDARRRRLRGAPRRRDRCCRA